MHKDRRSHIIGVVMLLKRVFFIVLSPACLRAPSNLRPTNQPRCPPLQCSTPHALRRCARRRGSTACCREASTASWWTRRLPTPAPLSPTHLRPHSKRGRSSLRPPYESCRTSGRSKRRREKWRSPGPVQSLCLSHQTEEGGSGPCDSEGASQVKTHFPNDTQAKYTEQSATSHSCASPVKRHSRSAMPQQEASGTGIDARES